MGDDNLEQDGWAPPAPPWRRSTGGPRPRREPLHLDAVVAVALDILDEEGLRGLSMRRVAQELGTGAASLYAYVSNKEELLDLVLDRIMGEIPLPEPDPEHWAEQLKQVATDGLAVLLNHRDIGAVSLARMMPSGPNGLKMVDAMLGIMRCGGLSDETTAFGADLLGLLVTGTACEHGVDIDRRLPGSGTLEERLGAMQSYFEALPSEHYPHLVAMMPALMQGDPQQRFEFALDIVIAGLAASKDR